MVLLLVATGMTRSARADLQFDVFLGFDGTIREASWFPIVCEIKNTDAGFTGVIQVVNDGGQIQQMPVELPSGTLKRIVIPVFTSGRYSTTWTVRLVDSRTGKMRSEQPNIRPRQQIGWEVTLLGSLPRTASGAPQFRPIAREQQAQDSRPTTARFQAQIFPDNPLVLEGLNALYLNSEMAANLRESQVQAIIGWLNAGGHLIVAIEQVSDITASPWLRGILPCEPKELQTISKHPELHEWLQGDGWDTEPAGSIKTKNSYPTKSADSPFADLAKDPAFEAAALPVITGNVRDGNVLVSCENIPLVVRANRGLGRVTVLMFSPEREPMKSWKNLPTFWSRVGEVPGVLYTSTDVNQRYGQSADGIFGAMIDSRQVHKLPIGWLLLLLLVYLVIIGPLDQWWLKRIGKPMLTWITFPCYVALFSLLIYFLGYKLRAGEAEYNEVHLVDVLRNGDRAELRGRTFASIYSPANNNYKLESGQKVATFRSEFLAHGGDGAEKGQILHTGDNFKAEVFVPVWVSQLYVSDWWHTATPPLSVRVSPASDGWQVVVQNNTDKPIAAGHLVIAGNIYSVGDVGAGKSKTTSVKQGSGSSLQSFVRQHGQMFHNAVNARQRAFGESERGQIDDLPNATVAASFVTQMDADDFNSQNFLVPPGLDLSAAVKHGNATLLAWMPDHSPVKPMNQFKPKRSFQHTLWRVPVSIDESR